MVDTPAADDAAAGAGLVADNIARLEQERASVERELTEIEMLLTQARTEAERHETRRIAAEGRFTELLRPYANQSGLGDSHQQLMLQAQRAALMSAQLEVLEGKQRVLRRYADGLRQQIEAMASEAGTHDVLTGAGPSEGSTAASREVLAAQEELRRVIARRMHDGPAQSIANIALQAQVAQRLLSLDPAAADRELDELRRIVQHALEATKDFIFEIRPMVLDDLGLLPTLRRAVRERAQRVGIAVALESHGADRRLGREIESNLFRIVDDAVAAYLTNSPAEVLVRLEWADDQVAASIRATPPALPAEPPPPPPEKPGRDLPPALAGMIADQAAGVVARAEAKRRAYGLPDTIWRELESRARTVDIALSLADDGLLLEACTQPPTVPIME